MLLVIELGCVEMVQFLQLSMQGRLRVDLVGLRTPECRLIGRIRVGLNDGIDGSLNGIEVDMQQDDVVLVDFLHMISHPLASLVQPLRVVNNGGLKIRAVVVVAV